MTIERLEIQDATLCAIGEQADRLGVSAYVVGGYVRDRLLGKEGKDVDIVVLGDGGTIARQIASALGWKEPVVFEKFGTAMCSVGDVRIEFVGARSESYADSSRKPSVKPATLDEDLLRRDFTVNAMAVSLNAARRGTLIDTLGGREDLAAGLLRTPRDPQVTFKDDPLRMMRTVRFAAQLGFVPVDDVLAAIGDMRERMSIVSMERVADEFLKMMASPRPSTGLLLLYESGLADVVLPELSQMAGVEQRKEYHHKDVLRHTLQVLDNVCGVSDKVWLRVAALMHDIAKPRTKAFKEGIGWTFHGHEEIGARMIKPIFRRLKLPFTHVPYVEKLVRLHLRPMALVDSEVTDSAVRRLMFDAGEEIDDLMVLCKADITSKNHKKVSRIRRNYDLVLEKMIEVEKKDKIRAWQPPLRGEEIIEICSIPASPLVGAMKDAITDAILDGRIQNNHDEALRFLLSIKDGMIEGFKKTGKAPKIPKEKLFQGKTPPSSD